MLTSKNYSIATKLDINGRQYPAIAASQSLNKHLAAAATVYNASTNRITWSVDKPTTVILSAVGLVAAGIQNDESCLVVYDAPTSVIASNWLSQTGLDIVYDEFSINNPLEISFYDANGKPYPITYLDFLPLNVNQRIIVKAGR